MYLYHTRCKSPSVSLVVSQWTVLCVYRVQAESVTAKMISEGRMDGSIDQISGVVHFKCKVKQCALLYEQF